MNSKKKIQDEQYSFPYHHIVSLENNSFSLSKILPWGHIYMSYIQFVINLLKKNDFNSLLDVGCGDGKFLYELNKSMPNKFLTGIDYTDQSIQFAKLFNKNNNINFLTKNILNEPIDEKYDVITLIEVIEHIHPDELKTFLEAIKKLLNKNGILIITTPTENAKLIKKHYQHFSLNKIKHYTSNIFKIKKTYYINKISKTSYSITKVLSNRFFILNWKPLINFLYRHYNKKLLITNKKNGSRIVVICKNI